MKKITYTDFSLLIASGLIIIAITVLFGWFLAYQPLTVVIPDYPSMKANTAIGFILLGISLICRHFNHRILGLSALLLLILLASLTLLQYSAGYHLPIDQWLVADPWSAENKGRMSIATALSRYQATHLVSQAPAWECLPTSSAWRMISTRNVK